MLTMLVELDTCMRQCMYESMSSICLMQVVCFLQMKVQIDVGGLFCIDICVWVYRHVCKHANLHACVPTCACLHMHIYIYIHTYIQACTRQQRLRTNSKRSVTHLCPRCHVVGSVQSKSYRVLQVKSRSDKVRESKGTRVSREPAIPACVCVCMRVFTCLHVPIHIDVLWHIQYMNT